MENYSDRVTTIAIVAQLVFIIFNVTEYPLC